MIRKLSNLVAPVSVLGKIIHDTWRWEGNVEFMNLGEIRVMFYSTRKKWERH